jgi:predicted metal-binding protein
MIASHLGSKPRIYQKRLSNFSHISTSGSPTVECMAHCKHESSIVINQDKNKRSTIRLNLNCVCSRAEKGLDSELTACEDVQ